MSDAETLGDERARESVHATDLAGERGTAHPSRSELQALERAAPWGDVEKLLESCKARLTKILDDPAASHRSVIATARVVLAITGQMLDACQRPPAPSPSVNLNLNLAALSPQEMRQLSAVDRMLDGAPDNESVARLAQQGGG